MKDFGDPSYEKYVFRGISEFVHNEPYIITGENYDMARSLFAENQIQINIFNISKFNTESKEGSKKGTPRMRRLSEYLGQSYFDYLSSLDDLVILMDEAHRYHADASKKAINELRPILGLEMTATPTDEKALADRLQRIYRQWERLSFHFGDAKGTKFRNIAQSFVLKELLNGANTYLRRLTDRYELACQAGSLTILLRDYYQGGSARPTSTLSGGESFLVSLSLALGLSSLNQHRLSTDMLFIDEGFGTLSEDYLNTVMDTLERLHQLGGKKVGIISHVEGLRERIKTQIQVNRIDNSRSEIRVIRAL